MEENQTIKDDDTKSDKGTLPRHRKARGYIRRDQPRERPRELSREDRHEQGKDEWYERRGRYNGRKYDDEPYHERCGYHKESIKFNPKLDIFDFEGIMQPNDFLDWLNNVERVFEYCDP